MDRTACIEPQCLYNGALYLLIIIRRYYSVYTEIGMSCVYVDWLLAGSEESVDINA